MIKIVFAILLFVLSSTDAQSQRNKHFFITLDQGLSLPVGKFKSKEYNPGLEEFKEVNGLAKAGYQFSVSGGYQFNKTIGVMIQVGESFNKQDEESFEENFRDNSNINDVIKIKTKHWAIFKGLGGIVMHSGLGVKQQFFIEGKLLAGICKTNVPGYEFYVYTTDPGPGLPNPYLYSYGKAAKMDIPSAFCWQINTGLGYRTKNKLYFLFDVNYFNSKSIYKFTAQPFGQPPPPVNLTYEYNLNSIGINATIGIEL